MSLSMSSIGEAQRALVRLMGRPMTYRLHTGETGSIVAFSRGVRADDLFAGALQQDIAVVFAADDFVKLFPARTSPARMDRLTIGGATYAVQEWRGAPQSDDPVVFKLLLRGGSQ